MTKKGDKIQKKIIRILLKEERPLSTRELAMKFDISWHTVQQYCLELLASGKLERLRIGTTHAWMLKKEKIVDSLLTKTIDNEIEALQKQLEEIMKKKQEQSEGIIISNIRED